MGKREVLRLYRLRMQQRLYMNELDSRCEGYLLEAQIQNNSRYSDMFWGRSAINSLSQSNPEELLRDNSPMG